MSESERLTETLRVSVMLETTKRKSGRAIAYLKIAEKAYQKFLIWNQRLMRYDIAERKAESWTIKTTKIKTAMIAGRAYEAYKRCMEIYVRLIKEL